MAESDQTRDYLVYATKVLSVFFETRTDVYVSGNLFIYYEEGNPEMVVAPDVFVVFGVENRQRRIYKVWEEGDRTPNFVLEITSKTTRSKDQGAKKGIYAFLGVEEYYQYDPTGDYLTPHLQGLRLVDGSYVPVPTTTLADGTIAMSSDILGLELHLKEKAMRFYDPATQRYLLTHEEEAAARQTAEARAERLAAKLRELNIDPDAL
ncbi:Uma2 family endonuclease [Vacuolonema iberomarrocanum]|uniref:Uma2 family endonuclease n=1 Tax=Vacuolonema iberomarrocanum TaxID=3454632 RepID=UPI003F6DA5F6